MPEEREPDSDLQQELSQQLSDIVKLERKVVELKAENDELRKDIKAALQYIEYSIAVLRSPMLSLTTTQMNERNSAVQRLYQRYGLTVGQQS